MMKKIIEILKKIDPAILTIAAIALLVAYLNFYGNFDILGNDLSLSSLYWRDLLSCHFYLWTDLFNNGVYNAVNLSQIFGATYSYLFNPNHWLGFALLLFLSNYLYYIWLKLLSRFVYGKNREPSDGVFFVCSLLFTYNFYTLSIFTQPLTSYHLILIFLPLVFILALKAFEAKKNLFLVLLSLVFVLGLSVNLAHFLVMVFVLLTFLSIIIFSDKARQIWFLKRVPLVVLMFLLLSAYIWLPILLVKVNPYFQYAGVDENNVLMTALFNSRFTDIFHISQMREMVWLSDFSYFYSKIPRLYFVVYSFLVPLYLLILIFPDENKKERLIKISFLLLLILGLFTAKGFNQPFHIINQLFYQLRPASIFRNNYDKFVIILQFAIPVLLMFSLVNLRKINKFLYSVIAIIGVLVIIFPFTLNIVNPDYKTRIPKDYQVLDQLDQSGNILILPNYYENGYVYATWYRGVGFYPVVLHRKNTNELDYYKYGIFDIKNINNLESYKENQLKILDKNFLAAYNIRYIIVDKTYLDYYVIGQGGGILAQLGQQKSRISQKNLDQLGFEHIISNNSLEIYKVSDQDFLPEIFSASGLKFYKDDNKNLSHVASDKQSISETQIFDLQDQNLEAESVDLSSATVSYRRLNPTKYEIKVLSNGTFPLIFSQSYDKNWLLSLAGSEIKTNHFVANGYANGWLIDSKKLCKNNSACRKSENGEYEYKLLLQFMPQKIFVYSAFISIISLIFFIFYGVISDKKNKN